MGRTGVAISTTGDEHRLDLLAQCVKGWDEALPFGASLFVTVDGDERAWDRVREAVDEWTGSVFQIGQPVGSNYVTRHGRLGVAANKNTGLELLMDNAGCDRMFLSDDDSWPLRDKALAVHTLLGLPHSMVCWGRYRGSAPKAGIGSWTWPRGSVLYVEREAVERVGGMIEAFGAGGHEHVEWSRRIHQAGMTPVLYPTPLRYTEKNFMGAAQLWHCEDMPRPGEPLSNLRARRRRLTSVRREPHDALMQQRIMDQHDGITDFVPYRAQENGRLSATLFPITGAEAPRVD